MKRREKNEGMKVQKGQDVPKQEKETSSHLIMAIYVINITNH